MERGKASRGRKLKVCDACFGPVFLPEASEDARRVICDAHPLTRIGRKASEYKKS